MNRKGDRLEILIAEDSRTQALLLQGLLEAHGYEVCVAHDGKEALAQMEKRRPMLVMSDVMMPELDGYGLCRAIKADARWKHVPVVLVTTLSDPADVIRGLECGADNFIRKPYEEQYLLARIEYLLMNIALRGEQRMQMALTVNLGGSTHSITAERQQILDLLISTYEQAVRVNNELVLKEKALALSNQILQGLTRMAQGLNRALSERQVVDAALEHALDLPGIRAGWIYLNKGEADLQLAGVRGLPTALSSPENFEGECSCQRKVLSGESHVVTNVLQCERLVRSGAHGPCWHASVPLWLGETRILGVMNLAGAAAEPFDDNELRTLHGIGNQVAIALERVRLHEHLEQAVQERTAKLAEEVEERKRIEREQARLVSIIEGTPDLVASASLDGRIRYCNPAGLRLLGYESSDNLCGTSLRDFAARNLLDEALAHAVEHGSWSGETVLKRRDGYEIPVLQVVLAHLGPTGSPEYISAIARDISERKRNEEDLKRTQALLNETGRLAKVGGFELHIDTQELVWSEELHRFYELDADFEPTLERLLQFTAPSSRSLEQQAIQRATENGEPFDLELEVRTARGTPRWIHSIGRLDRTQRKIYGAQHDITERKQAEFALRALNEDLERRVMLRTADLERARQDAEEANRAKSAFLALMSHEIRTPMNGVLGMIEILALGNLSEQQADLVSTVRSSAVSLLGIIDDILDFSKIEAGRLDIEQAPVSVTALVEGICNSMLPLAALRATDLALFVSPQIPALVISDELRLRQVLYNIIGNALKFSVGRSDKRGRVSVRVEVSCAAPLQLSFRISDNGIGMAPETVANLFTPFTQAEVSTTRRFGGTGLGLAICQRLVNLMHGEISVASTLGDGSVFTVRLPFEVPPEQPSISMFDLSGCHCILVDSADLDALDLAEYLTSAGASVRLVVNMEEAVEAAGSSNVPVVVIQDAGREKFAIAPLREVFATAPNASHLLLTHGQRRRCRVEALQLVTLDRDALRRQAFLQAVAVAAGRASPEVLRHDAEGSLPAQEAAPPSIETARRDGQLILVAEDDTINQKVILQQLALLGYAAEIASTGAEALRLWRRQSYGLLLTDVHMPDMDGYTLSEIIRREEAGQRRIPIIALSANALRGQAKHARALGMDEYLTKPVQLRTLQTAIEKYLPARAPGTARFADAEKNPNTEALPVLDPKSLEALVGPDIHTVRMFFAEYLDSARDHAKALVAASSANDSERIAAVAHKLKSSSRAVGALALGELCVELEKAGQAPDFSRMAKLMLRFNMEFAQVEQQIGRVLSAEP